jgi:hypothetical protein
MQRLFTSLADLDPQGNVIERPNYAVILLIAAGVLLGLLVIGLGIWALATHLQSRPACPYCGARGSLEPYYPAGLRCSRCDWTGRRPHRLDTEED